MKYSRRFVGPGHCFFFVSFVLQVVIKNRHLYHMVARTSIAFILICIIWVALDPPRLVTGYSANYEFQWCASDYYWGNLAALAAAGLFLLSGIYLTYKTRNNPGLFNESRHISYILYNTFIVGAGLIGVSYGIANDEETLFILKSIGFIFIPGMSILLLFGPKFYYLICNHDMDMAIATQSSTESTHAMEDLIGALKDRDELWRALATALGE